MKICIPVEADQGLASQVCGHFGAAPAFLIVDTDTKACRAIVNNNQHHSHGGCQPMRSIAGETIDGMVVGGIGMGALNKLIAAKIQVFRAAHATAGETVAAFLAGSLQPMLPGMACAGHGGHHHDSAHDHGHGHAHDRA